MQECCRSRRRSLWSLPFVVLALGACLAASPAHAGQPPVALGEVTTSVSRTSMDIPKTFRAEIEREFRLVDLRASKSKERFVLSASLVEMETRTEKGGVKTTCVVSATLRKASGDLYAILKGKARVQDASPSETELSAMRTAIHSAFRKLPEVVK